MSDLLTVLPDLVAARTKMHLPDLRTCKGTAGRFNLERLKGESIPAPAVLISIVGLRQGPGGAGPMHFMTLDMAAFIVTKDAMGLPRDAAAAAITQAICTLVPDRRWGRADCGEASDVRGQPLITKATDQAASSLWTVTWQQPCTFDVCPPAEPIDPTIYAGQVPLIGAEHVDEYERFGEEP